MNNYHTAGMFLVENRLELLNLFEFIKESENYNFVLRPSDVAVPLSLSLLFLLLFYQIQFWSKGVLWPSFKNEK